MSLPERVLASPPLRFDERVDDAVDRGLACLLSLQRDGGYWLGELGADSTLESDYIFYLTVLGRRDRIGRLARRVRGCQLPDGGWSIYEGGPAELNATVKAYFALKLAGDLPGDPHMRRARARVLELGGLEHTNSFVRFYLALAGVIPWHMVPAMPPELMLLPRWVRLNIYEMSAWTRAILVPLTILYARKVGWRVPARAALDELFCHPGPSAVAFERDSRLLTWRNAFLVLNRAAMLTNACPGGLAAGWRPTRGALAARTSERSHGLAAITPR